jgi:hypothetical protein
LYGQMMTCLKNGKSTRSLGFKELPWTSHHRA